MIEVLVAMSVFAVGLTAILSTFNMVRQTYALQRDMGRANQVGERWLEQAVMLSRDNANIQSSTTPKGPLYYDKEGKPATTAAAQYFTLTWVVTTVDIPTNTKRVDATVAWTSYGRPHTTRMYTYVVG